MNLKNLTYKKGKMTKILTLAEIRKMAVGKNIRFSKNYQKKSWQKS